MFFAVLLLCCTIFADLHGLFPASSQLHLEKMTLEEKVGQLFMAYFDGEEVNENAKRLLSEAKVGGIIYYQFSNGLNSPEQIRKMSSDLQSLAKKQLGIPLLIAVDQEGGIVSMLKQGFTEFPGNGALGRVDRQELVRKASHAMGVEMSAVGINLNLAPVTDVNNNPKNPIIGIRSFGADPEKVARLAKASLLGFREAGVIPCLKHFPGHGDVIADSHEELPIVPKTLEEIEKIELKSFAKLSEETPMIMTAHILFPQIDSEHCATLSPIFLREILREKLGFEGVIMSDSLTMKGVLQGEAIESVAERAFLAGNDILLIGGRVFDDPSDEGKYNIDEVVRIYRHLLKAVQTGKINEERVNQSVRRILQLKKEAGLEFSDAISDLQILQNKEHCQIASQIARESFFVMKGEVPKRLQEMRIAIAAPSILEEKIKATSLSRLGKSVRFYFYDFSGVSDEILEILTDADYVMFFSYNAWRYPVQLALIQKICRLKPVACIATRDPYDVNEINEAEMKGATFSPSQPSLQAVADYFGI